MSECNTTSMPLETGARRERAEAAGAEACFHPVVLALSLSCVVMWRFLGARVGATLYTSAGGAIRRRSALRRAVHRWGCMVGEMGGRSGPRKTFAEQLRGYRNGKEPLRRSCRRISFVARESTLNSHGEHCARPAHRLRRTLTARSACGDRLTPLCFSWARISAAIAHLAWLTGSGNSLRQRWRSMWLLPCFAHRGSEL